MDNKKDIDELSDTILAKMEKAKDMADVDNEELYWQTMDTVFAKLLEMSDDEFEKALKEYGIEFAPKRMTFLNKLVQSVGRLFKRGDNSNVAD